MVQFNQKAWLKACIDMNTKPRENEKNNFEKDIFKLMNKATFGKSMENLWKHRNIKLVTTKRRTNYLVWLPNYSTRKFFTENLLAIEMRKTKIIMNESVYLGLSILDHSETVMHELWYDHVNPKYVIWIQTASFFI